MSRFALVSLLLACPVSFATTYYVGGSGGSSTIQSAVDKAQAGDVVLVRSGTYSERVQIKNSGTASNYIVVKADQGAMPVIDGKGSLPGTSQWDGLLEIKAQYVEVNGLTVKNSTGRGIRATTGSSDVRILNCNVNYNWQAGIHVELSPRSLVRGNKVWQNARTNAGANRDVADWPGALMIVDTDSGHVAGNEVYQNHGEGIIYLRSTGGTIEDNVCWDNLKVQLYLDNAAQCLVQRNLCYSTDNKEFWRWAPDNPGYGLYIANEVYSGKRQVLGQDVVIINNIIFHCGHGISFWTEGGLSGSALKNYTIANNVIYDTFLYGFKIGSATASHSARIWNNIVHTRGTPATSASWSGLDFKNNCWAKSPASQAASAGDVNADPQIAGAGSTGGGEMTGNYFKLKSSSPCIDKALALDAVKADFFGSLRETRPDIGIHEHGGGVVLAQLRRRHPEEPAPIGNSGRPAFSMSGRMLPQVTSDRADGRKTQGGAGIFSASASRSGSGSLRAGF